MPLVRIDLDKAAPVGRAVIVGEVVCDAMRTVAGVPEDDKFQIVTRHDHGEIIYPSKGYLGVQYSPDLVVVQITWNAGRSVDVKERFYRDQGAAERSALARPVGVTGRAHSRPGPAPRPGRNPRRSARRYPRADRCPGASRGSRWGDCRSGPRASRRDRRARPSRANRACRPARRGHRAADHPPVPRGASMRSSPPARTWDPWPCPGRRTGDRRSHRPALTAIRVTLDRRDAHDFGTAEWIINRARIVPVIHTRRLIGASRRMPRRGPGFSMDRVPAPSW
ncbi:hypothetical protein DMC47_43585 [Nostoc sp. 3335mG]|nr:hypothetical protein DMC47_43585 [Nostoc sp. 3335mG]